MEPRDDRPEMPMELQIDRLGLPMERRRLKIDGRGYETETGISSSAVIL